MEKGTHHLPNTTSLNSKKGRLINFGISFVAGYIMAVKTSEGLG